MQKQLAVVLVSGGLDSCVTAAIAAQEHRLALLHINYGQRTEKRELQAFHGLADHFNAEHRMVVDISYLRDIGGSSLTDESIEVPKADLDSHEIPSSYVPFRNANFLAIATSWAEVLPASRVFIGAMEEDSSGYPDCRAVFFEAFGKVIEEGTKPSTTIEIAVPIIHLSKAEVVRKGLELGAPFELTWSCYKSEDLSCGVCDSCALRLRGFRLNNARDPIPYRDIPFRLQPGEPS